MAKTKILAVDDEPHILELISAVLSIEGFDVLKAHNGQEALSILKEEKPELVILDMMMPGMSGREVCENIRKNPETKNIKVIFVTVAKFSEIGKKILDELDVSAYITKPFDNKELVDTVKKNIE